MWVTSIEQHDFSSCYYIANYDKFVITISLCYPLYLDIFRLFSHHFS